ncbi:MAG: hypothetical protein AAGA92_05770 [Planctomycetota bacterium]
MHSRSAICVVVDGLRASALGAYGNTMYPTPTLDALAATSTVVERVICTEPTVDSFYRHVWLKAESCLSTTGGNNGFLHRLGQERVESTVFTDDPAVAALAEESGASRVVLIQGVSRGPAASVDATDLARLLINAAEFVSSWRETSTTTEQQERMLWVHCKGLASTWDAPLDLRRELLDDDEIQPFAGAAPPFGLSPEDDPDVLLSYRAAYAAQVAVLDVCIAALLTASQSLSKRKSPLFAMTSCRGLALGEHQSSSAPVHNECLHVPSIIGFSEAQRPGLRVAGLQTPDVVTEAIEAWFGHEPTSTTSIGAGGLPNLVSVVEPWYAVRTNDWTLIDLLGNEQSEPADTTNPRLYASPDDRWELNNVAERCPDIVAELQQLAAASTPRRKNPR